MKNKVEQGITLIVLIITIIILLILAVVVSRIVSGDGVIWYAQNGVKNYADEQIMEQIKLAIQEHMITKYAKSNNQTLAEFLEEKDWCKKAIENEDESIIITTEEGKQYKVDKNGNITSLTGIYLNKTKIILELIEGKTITEEITANTNGIEGEIKWTNTNNNVAALTQTTKNSVIITAIEKGKTTITATCDGYSMSCTVMVEDFIPIGTFVKYDVSYEDIFTTNLTFDAQTGWRFLGRDDEGNKLLISTGIPGILHYNESTKAGVEENGWWGTDTEVATEFGEQYAIGYKSCQNRYAAYGMRYHFEKIPYTRQKSGTTVAPANTMIGTVEGKGEDGTLGTAFRASEEDKEIIRVRILTLEELNRTINKVTGSTRLDTSRETGAKDLTGAAEGLFDMMDLQNLKNIKNLDNYNEKHSYWLATPCRKWSRLVYEFINF